MKTIIKRLHPTYNHKVTRAWHNIKHKIQKESLVFPIFVSDVPTDKKAINSMPEQYQWGTNRLEELLDPLVKKGLQSVLLFGAITETGKKDVKGTWADLTEGPVIAALTKLQKLYPDVLRIADVCMCQYTSHGHCGIFKETHHKNVHHHEPVLDNEKSIERISEIALRYAQAGANMVAPSDMMDGRIGAIKYRLAQEGLSHIPVMGYSAKYASCMYGPFRDAAHSTPQFGDRRSYQLPNYSRLGIEAIKRDIEEGADFIMVKPAGGYLDVIYAASQEVSNVPIAAYQVSGEYSMLWHGANGGCFDLKTGVMESLTSIKRAGADIIITYYVPKLLDWLD